jgi:hypothetical protein
MVLPLLAGLGPESAFLGFGILVLLALSVISPGVRTKGRSLTRVAR